MGNKLKKSFLSGDLANLLGLPLTGVNIPFFEIRPLDEISDGSLSFAKTIAKVENSTKSVIIAPPGTPPYLGAVIAATNPRLAFARALKFLEFEPGFIEANTPPLIHPSAQINSTAALGMGVQIGARTVIGHNVIVADGVTIGSDCVIKSNSVIGEAGFGFERDETGLPVRILHLGSVIIGDRVEIGSLNTICRATLGRTIIENDVKTDDHVHIAHNCRVRRGALLTACTELSGGVDVGEFAWIGPNTSVMQKVIIGNSAKIGIGSNVTKSIPDGVTVGGNPARALLNQK